MISPRSRVLTLAGLVLLLTHAPTARGDFFISSGTSVLRYGNDGASLGVFAGGLTDAEGLAFGPGGDLFVVDGNTKRILRFDGTTGASKGIFAAGAGLTLPVSLAFGPSGDIFVANISSLDVSRFDGGTGAYKGVFTSGSDIVPTGIDPYGLAFGTGGDLFVRANSTSELHRYDGQTGASKGVFASGFASGLGLTYSLTFGPSGDLFVEALAGQGNRILRFDGITGSSKGTFASGSELGFPKGLTFGPGGDLFVVNADTNQLVRYDGTTGAFEGALISVIGPGRATYVAFAQSSAVPEPSSVLLIILGLTGLTIAKRFNADTAARRTRSPG